MKKTLMQQFTVAAAVALLSLASQVVAQSAPDKVVIWSPGDNGSVKDWNTDPILAQVEAATNTDIEMVKIGWDVYTDQINAAIASGDMPDIIGVVDHGNISLLNQWVRDGVLVPLEGDVAAGAPNIMAYYADPKNEPLTSLKFSDQIYGVPNFWDSGPAAGNPIHLRKDLLDKYGMAAPETIDEYFSYLEACKNDGLIGVTFSGQNGIVGALAPFAGAHGLPTAGWVKTDSGWGHWAVQPGMKDALLKFREMVSKGLVNLAAWEITGDESRAAYVSGKACSTIWNGGGHIGRIQNDMTLVNPDFKEWVLPAPTDGSEARGYTGGEVSFWGLSFIMNSKQPVAAARVLNYLASEEGLKLTALGIKDIDYTEDSNGITLLPARSEHGFPSEAGDTGAHPLGTTLVSWVPQTWQDFSLLYGKDQAFKDWYAAMWVNMRKYEMPIHGTLIASPLWTDFQATGAELMNRTFLQIVQSGSAEEAASLFDQFVIDWNALGGADATQEMSALLDSMSAK